MGDVQNIFGKTATIEVPYYLHVDVMYIIYGAHLTVGHGGRHRLRKEANRKYGIFTVRIINMSLSV
jgi:hypothetical protein